MFKDWVWYLTVSIPDLCSFFTMHNSKSLTDVVMRNHMKKNTSIATKEWFEKKFLVNNGFACLFEITIFKYKLSYKIFYLS